jgi:hypothetical protein|tara:strand:+ start:549 stop:755 length:207 start_codon:yes stop_codon:yes gene_type:complete
MTTWSIQTISPNTWTTVPETARGYIETEDNLFLLTTENNELIQQEDLTDISELDYQDTTDSSTTWIIQ